MAEFNVGNVENITDDNIHQLVRLYVDNRDSLPTYLQGISISKWDVSRVTNMAGLFEGLTDFNESLNEWDVSNVTRMVSMFNGCKSFNQPLDKWNITQVTDMEMMFEGCESFNQPLNKWNVTQVTDMNGMFWRCESFNQPLDKWNVTQVTNMSSMFSDCLNFNQPLNNWDVSNVTDMHGMFSRCESFDQPLDNWNVSNVTDMDSMFNGCLVFNQPLAGWDVSNVTDMTQMFNQAMTFDRPLNSWDVSNVINRQGMFEDSAISEINKPDIGEQPYVRVDAYQIHKSAGKINYNKLNEILKEKSGSPERPLDLDFPTFIKTSIATMIDSSEESATEKQAKHNGLNQIMTQRLDGVNYTDMSPLLLDSIYYTLNYIDKQSIPFKDNYVNTFIQECVQAYEGEGAIAMTCATGALERIVNSLVTPCELLISSEPEEDDDTKTQCELLKSIISYNPKKLVIEYINDWYKLHTKEPFPEGTSEDEKRDDLKTYLLDKLPGQTELIDSNLEYLDFEDDAFQYIGGKRKTRKRQSKKKKITKRAPKKLKVTKRKTMKIHKVSST